MTSVLLDKKPMILIKKRDSYFKQAFLKNMESYFKQNPPDCSLYSQDNFEFPVHKEVLYQTMYLCEIIKNSNSDTCCCKIEILCQSISKEELKIMVDFLYTGNISCDNASLGISTCKNLNTMFGFPINIIENQFGKSQLVTDSESRSKKCDNSDCSAPLTHEGSDTLNSDVPILKSTEKCMIYEKENILFTKSISYGQEDYTIKEDNDIIMVSFSFCENNLLKKFSCSQ